jgi:rhodanese-related sulfurtransferase
MACVQQLHRARQCALRPSRASASRVRRVGPIRASAGTAAKVEKFPLWRDCYFFLLEKKLESLTAEEAHALSSEEWQVVDVRPPASFEKAHIEGAVSVPLYQAMNYSNASPASFLKAAVYFVNGVSPIEMNPKFSEQIAEVAKGGKGLVLYCEAGGSLKPNINFPEGKSSRSLQACFRTLREGLSDKVVHLDGGIYSWYKAGKPLTGEYDTSDVGRTPNVV